MSQPEKQTIEIHILPNISWSEDKQTMRFGHLIEYNTKCSGETIPRPLSKKIKFEHISGSIV